jgi:hypothetical protein
MAAWGAANPDPTTTGGSSLDKLLQFAQSNGGSSLISGVLNGFGNLAQNTQNQQNFQQQLSQNSALAQAQMAMQANQGNQQNDLTRQLALAQQAPTGWDQQYEQQQLLRNLMLQKLTNPSGGYIPQAIADRLGTAGKQFTPTIPDEWKNANVFGLDATQQSLAQRQGVLDLLSQGKAPGIDFMHNGYQNSNPDRAQALQDQTNQYRQYVGNDANTNLQNLQEAINLSRNANTGKGGGGGGSSLGAHVGGAASGAMTGATIGSVVPGIGTGIGAGVGALIGAFKGKGGGGSTGDTSGPLGTYQFMQGPQNPYAGFSGGSIAPPQGSPTGGGGSPMQPPQQQYIGGQPQPQLSQSMFADAINRARQAQMQQQLRFNQLIPYNQQGRG